MTHRRSAVLALLVGILPARTVALATCVDGLHDVSGMAKWSYENCFGSAFPTAALLLALAPALALARDPMRFEATAYSEKGQTADGSRPKQGVVAADPQILPLGTRIRIHDAGKYDGVYVVKDTGPALEGREIDIYVPTVGEAIRFGRKQIRVEILERGTGGRQDAAAEPAPRTDSDACEARERPRDQRAEEARGFAERSPTGSGGIGGPQPTRAKRASARTARAPGLR